MFVIFQVKYLLSQEGIILMLKKYCCMLTIAFTIMLFLCSCNSTTVVDDDTITIACYLNGFALEQFVSEYNNSSDYQIELIDYSQYNQTEESSEGIDKLIRGITAGEIPDILVLNNLPIETFMEQGILEDLYPYISADDEIDKEDFFVNILEAVEVDNQLLFIPSNFFIDTLIIHGDSGISGGWTIEEMYEYISSADFQYLIKPSTFRYEFLEMLISHNIDGLIDWASKEPLFDSELFKQITEICELIPESEIEDTYTLEAELIKSGAQLMSYRSIMDFFEFQELRNIFSDDFEMVGLPSTNNAGSTVSFDASNTLYSIASSSPHKDQAWEIIKALFTNYEYAYFGFPTYKDAFNAMIEASRKEESSSYTRTDMYGNQFEATIEKLTDEDIEATIELIESVNYQNFSDTAIVEIVVDEMKSYYNEEKSFDETVAIINDRVKVYINE